MQYSERTQRSSERYGNIDVSLARFDRRTIDFPRFFWLSQARTSRYGLNWPIIQAGNPLAFRAMKQFAGTRTKIHVLRTETDLYGYVGTKIEHNIPIELVDGDALRVGDEVEVFLSNSKSSTSFNSTYLGKSESRFCFSVPALMRLDGPVAQTRRKPNVEAVHLITDDGETEVEAVDLGPKGIGIRSELSFEAGIKVKMRVKGPTGEMEFNGEVVYSRFEEEKFVTGVRIESIDRIAAARWDLLLAA